MGSSCIVTLCALFALVSADYLPVNYANSVNSAGCVFPSSGSFHLVNISDDGFSMFGFSSEMVARLDKTSASLQLKCNDSFNGACETQPWATIRWLPSLSIDTLLSNGCFVIYQTWFTHTQECYQEVICSPQESASQFVTPSIHVDAKAMLSSQAAQATLRMLRLQQGASEDAPDLLRQ